MELIVSIIGLAFLFYICKLAGDKRSETTHRCPNCGTICHANRRATRLRHRDFSEVHSFKCPNCGYEFYD